MSCTHGIDIGEPEPLFFFDTNDSVDTLNCLEVSAREPTPSFPADTSGPSLKTSSTSRYRERLFPNEMSDANAVDIKGKSVSHSMLTHSQEVEGGMEGSQDIFSMSLGSASAAEPMEICSSPVGDLHLFRDANSTDDAGEDVDPDDPIAVLPSRKGKGRDIPPTLPPLSFETSEPSYAFPNWPTTESSPPAAGPSSFGSNFEAAAEPQSAPRILFDPVVASPDSPQESFTISRIPSRRRSLGHISMHSRRSDAITKVKDKISTSKRKLFKKRGSTPGSPSIPEDGSDGPADPVSIGCFPRYSCLAPSTYEFKPRASPVFGTIVPDFDGIEHPLPFYVVGRASDNTILRTKGRSYSSPLPLPTTVLDLVSATATDISHFPPPANPSYFDDCLPTELKLRVFIALVEVHEAEHERLVREGHWTMRKASKNKWVGKDRGIKELVKVSRVSRSWHTLVFDGQLWAKLDLRSFPKLPPAAFAQRARTAGGFVRHIDFTGHDLDSSTLFDITSHLSRGPSDSGDSPCTQLTTINLQGCRKEDIAAALHDLLRTSPLLRNLCLKGLPSVTNETCQVLAADCPNLVSLNLSRCSNLSGEGVAAFLRKEHPNLKELRLCGLRNITDRVMSRLGRMAPNLEILDLSYARDLHNSAIEAFVSCSEADSTDIETVCLTSREAGRDPSDPTPCWRRITRLRHLSLSYCTMLTDHACSHLAYAVPKLEFLEMAGMGPDLRDAGLVRLLQTTPLIRRLDLEEAISITDDVLFTVTPPQPPPAGSTPAKVPAPLHPGHALEHIIISNATEISNDAILDLVQNCTRLRTLEADNTRMSGHVVQEFVRLARSRSIVDAQVVAIDCRGVGEHTVKELVGETRPRIGWRAYEARKLGFLDARDDEGLGVGQDECDERRVALRTFYSWQTVDAVRAARDKKRRSRRGANASTSTDSVGVSTGRARWWSPGGRRSGGTSPTSEIGSDREGCTIM
ncbi:RNI-like protein [Wolfiporia cocos MD-104 SS10]|uniref:RNI-like protein n=1 Tax=Wolfiporia cocos (strain MD-104) TaxID=742152 RepID=A0A2H3IWF5_WOLCO|nr:RNI-like protein [Wolfiporia cocos MD-104 SS10]